MSHITLLQYVTQLQNLGLTQPQINASVQEWKKIHQPKKVEKLDQNAASFILQGAIDYIKR